LINRVLTEKNTGADLLSKLASSNLVDLSHEVWIEVLEKPSIEEGPIIAFVDTDDDWRTTIKDYSHTGELLPDRNEVSV
jgi:hypothetical protein